jgi:hypothetical protein
MGLVLSDKPYMSWWLAPWLRPLGLLVSSSMCMYVCSSISLVLADLLLFIGQCEDRLPVASQGRSYCIVVKREVLHW